MDLTTTLILGGGVVAIFIWAQTMLQWRTAVWFLIYYTVFMGLSIVVASNMGVGAVALVSRDILITAPLYFSLFLFTRNQPYFRVPWHVTVAYCAFAFIVIACSANPRVPNPLVAVIGAKVWLGYIPLMYVGAVFLRNERDLLGVSRAMVALAWIPWITGLTQYIGALTIGFEETMTAMFGEYGAVATGNFSCFDFGAPFCRLPGTFQFNSQYGVFCIFMLFPLFLHLVLEENKAWRGFAQLSIALAFIAGCTSGARGNLLLMPFAVMLIFFFRFKLKGGGQLAIGLVGAFIVIFNVIGIDADKAYGSAGKLGAAYGSDLVVGGFADGVAKGGLFGMGTGTNTGPARHAFDTGGQLAAETGYYIENFLAKTLAELGIIGFFSLLICFMMLGLHLLQGQFACKDPRMKDAAATVTALLAFTICTSVKGWALDVDPLNFYFYLFMGFGFAIPHLDRAAEFTRYQQQVAMGAGGHPAADQAAAAARYAYQGRYGRARSAAPKYGDRGDYGGYRYGGRYNDRN